MINVSGNGPALSTVPLDRFERRGDLVFPLDLETLGLFKALQRAVNTLRGQRVLAVDGVVGPETLEETVSAAEEILDADFGVASPFTLAVNADNILEDLEDFLEVSISRAPEPTRRQREAAETGEDLPAVTKPGSGKGKLGLLLLATGGAGLFWLSRRSDPEALEGA